MSKTDFSRHHGLLDHKLMAKSQIALVGGGGAAGLACLLARCGVGNFFINEFDQVSETNPATQGYDTSEIGLYKAEALARQIKKINSAANCQVALKRYQDLSQQEADIMWSSDIMLAMTDDFYTQARINKDAIARGKDAFFAICYTGNDAVEITATLPDELNNGIGCHRCHTKARYDAYESGFENPEVIASTALAAEYLNSQLALLIVSRLHHKSGSELPIASLARVFAKKPMLTSRIHPEFWSADGEPLADIADDQQLFTSRQWALDTPCDWVCPDCGTQGVINPSNECLLEFPTPPGESKRGAAKRRLSWPVRLLKAAFGRKAAKEEVALSGQATGSLSSLSS